jgi:hypothetical protein
MNARECTLKALIIDVMNSKLLMEYSSLNTVIVKHFMRRH